MDPTTPLRPGLIVWFPNPLAPDEDPTTPLTTEIAVTKLREIVGGD